MMTATGGVGTDAASGTATSVPRDYRDRLDFRLPPFLRLAWASAAARERWSEPLRRLADDVRRSEWLSVAAGLRRAAVVMVPQSQAAALSGEWSNRGLRSRVLGPDDALQVHALNGKTPKLDLADEIHLVTTVPQMDHLDQIWRSSDLVQLADFIGYPPCCARFLRTVAADRKYLDTTWAMTDGETFEENGAQIAEIADNRVNPLLSAIGVRGTPHRPCSFHCQPTQQLAAAYRGLRAEAASQPGQANLAEVLAWPVEWSSLHGIIEVKLPILKLCYEGDATANAYKVRLTGGPLPEQAAHGLDFPHRPPARRRKRTDLGWDPSELE